MTDPRQWHGCGNSLDSPSVLIRRKWWANTRAGMAALGLGAAAALVAAGCGSVQQPSAQRGPSGKVTITVWNDVDGTLPPGVTPSQYWVTRATALFEKTHPSIRVKVDPSPNAASASFETLLRSSEVAGNLPDVIQLYDGGQVIQNEKYLLPLNSYISTSYYKSLTVGWQWVSGGYKPKGTIYGVPVGEGYWYMVFYNKALFKKAGITDLPSSWAQLMSDARRIKAKGITPFMVGEQAGYTGAWTQDALISSLVGTNGVLQMLSGQKSLDSSTMIKAYTAWRTVNAEGLANSDALAISNNQAWAKFSSGQGAMTILGAGFDDAQIEKGLKSNLGLFPVPPLPGARYPKELSGGPNNEYSIAKTTKHPVQAMEYVKFMASTKVQQMALEGGFGQLPNNISFKAPSDLAKLHPVLSQVYKYIKVDHYGLAEAWDNIMPGSIDSYWYKTNTAVFGGSLSPKAAASNLEQQMKLYLATSKASAG